MNKTFVIRQIAYLYNDEYLSEHTMGGVKQVFSSEEEARKELIRLEREAFARFDLSSIEQFSGCSDRKDLVADRFDQYYQRRFGVEIVKTSQYGKYCESGTYLPKDLTDEDVMDIREIGEIKFYDLAEFPGKPIFWGIWKKEQYFAKPGWLDWLDAPLFFNSIENAAEVAIDKLTQMFYDLKIKGELPEISENPVILQSILDHSSGLTYDQEKRQLRIDYITDAEARTLNELLKEKVYEIKKLELEEVESIEHWMYERM